MEPGGRPRPGRHRRGRQRRRRHRHRRLRRRPRAWARRPGDRSRRGLPCRRRAARHRPPRRTSSSTPRSARRGSPPAARAGRVLAAAQAPRAGARSSARRRPSARSATRWAAGSAGWPVATARPATPCARSRSSRPTDRSCGPAASEHPELFRALRGGGGCVRRRDRHGDRAVPRHATCTPGNLYYPAAAAAEVVERWSAWVADAPDELTSAVVLMNVPPAPDVPEAVRGRSWTIVRGCWSGPLDEGRALLDEWRATMPPEIDAWTEMPFSDVGRDQHGPGRPAAGRRAPAAGWRPSTPTSAPSSRPARSPASGRGAAAVQRDPPRRRRRRHGRPGALDDGQPRRAVPAPAWSASRATPPAAPRSRRTSGRSRRRWATT